MQSLRAAEGIHTGLGLIKSWPAGNDTGKSDFYLKSKL